MTNQSTYVDIAIAAETEGYGMRHTHLFSAVFIVSIACDGVEDASIADDNVRASTPVAAQEDELAALNDDPAQPGAARIGPALCTGWDAGGRTCLVQCVTHPGHWSSTGAIHPEVGYGDCGAYGDAWCFNMGRGWSIDSCWGFPNK